MDSGVQELHFSHLHIPVTINNKFLVHPSNPTPEDQSPNHSLYLSNLDDLIGARVFTPSVYFYRSTNNNQESSVILKRLQEALGEVLVPYYPLSGRLREAENGKLEVFFGGEEEQDALMVSADSPMCLADLGDLTVPNPAWLPLIYRDQEEEAYKILEMSLLIAQVTFFACGGFSLGIRLCHCDGFGAMQFLGLWTAIAKTGKLVTDPEPVWDREVFKPRDPPMVKYPHYEFLPIEERSNLTKLLWETKPLQKCYKISKEFQSHKEKIRV